MPFDEFLAKRLTELLRFAAVLIGDARLAADVVVDVMCRAFVDWPALAVGGRPFVVVRTGVVRHYLAATIPDAPGLFGELTRPARAAVVLNVYSGQSAGEVADAIRIDLAQTDSLIAGARAALVESGGGVTLIDRLDLAADAADVDAEATAAAVLDRLERDDVDDGEDSASDLFGTSVGPGVPGPTVERHDHGPHPLFAFFDGADDHDPIRDGDEAGDEVGTDDVADPIHRRPRVAWTRVGSTAPLRALSAVVIVAAAVLLGLLVATDRRDTVSDATTDRPMATQPSTTIQPRVNPSDRIGYQLPGTRTLGSEFFGSGSGVRHGGQHSVAPGRELAIDAVCSGSGGATIGPVAIPRCNGTPVGAVVSPRQIRSLAIRTAGSTTWRFAIVDEPAHGTNGALVYPANKLIEAGSSLVTVARSAGSGSGRVSLPSGAVSARVADVRLLLTCDGSGVTFSSADRAFDGQYTHTCFSGWSYEFDVDSASLPGTLTVQAAPGTTWHLAVVRR